MEAGCLMCEIYSLFTSQLYIGCEHHISKYFYINTHDYAPVNAARLETGRTEPTERHVSRRHSQDDISYAGAKVAEAVQPNDAWSSSTNWIRLESGAPRRVPGGPNPTASRTRNKVNLSSIHAIELFQLADNVTYECPRLVDDSIVALRFNALW